MPSLPEVLLPLRLWIVDNLPGVIPLEMTIVSKDGQKIRLPIPQNKLPTERPLSSTEEQIVTSLADGAWHTGPQIAEAAGRSLSGAFSTILSNLAESGAIESSTKSGYRLPPNGKKDED